MAKKTDNQNWDVPEEGDTDYETTFSTFFEQIDRDVSITDLEADRTNYEPKSNAKFLASDTGAVYIGDGSSWNKISSSGDNPIFNSIDTDEATIAGKDGIGVGTSVSGDLSFGDWEQVSAERPARLSLQGEVETDGTDFGRIVVQIDESGGTTADSFQILANAQPSLGAGAIIETGRSFLLPAGAQYRIENNSDPNGTNDFTVERIFTL